MWIRGLFVVTLPLALLVSQTPSNENRLDRARRVNLAYAANMPSYVADETAKRYTSDPGSDKWRNQDTRFPINGLRNTPNVKCYDRKAGCHRLKHNKRKGILAGS